MLILGKAILYILIGWVLGTLINYLSDVLPFKRRLSEPFCTQCRAPYSLQDYFLRYRRCSQCGKPRGRRTWLVLACAIGATLWLGFADPAPLPFYLDWALVVYFGVVVVIDMEHRLIMHPVSLAGAVLGFITGTWLRGPAMTLLGGAAGFGSMLLLYLLGFGFTVLMGLIRGRKAAAGEALGFGDVTLSGVLGLILGWPAIAGGLIVAILLAGVVSLLYMVVMVLRKKYDAFSAIPYGPFLIAGAVMLLYFSNVLAAMLK